MSTFDEASLVFIPSGYKTSKAYSIKPTDGTGDLTFTRTGDTATRVGPDGLIQKVRTNLVLQSNTFSNAVWTKQNASVVSGQADPFGGNNAWNLIEDTTLNFHFANQSVTVSNSTLHTCSVYVKALGATTYCRISGNPASFVDFNLSNGTVGAQSNATGTITALSGGWYRLTCTYTSVSTSELFYIIINTGSFTGDGTSGLTIYAAQEELGDIATDYIATTTAAVSVGPVANVPRLDYLNSSCPRLLLEPQRTNLFLYSENLSGAYSQITNVTRSTNTQETISPNGYYNSTKLVATGSWAFRGAIAGTSTGTYTVSCYVKAVNAGVKNKFRLSAGGAVSDDLTATNEWVRYTYTATNGGATTNGLFRDSLSSDCEIYVYGLQLEAGSYPTSIIPTLGAAVTRGADACSKTGISSLIGQTEGTLFVEASLSNTTSDAFRGIAELNDGTTTNRITLFRNTNGTLRLFVRQSSTTQADISYGTLVTGSVKIAVAYANNDISFYVNGVQVGTDTSVTIPTCSDFDLGIQENNTDRILGDRINQALLFKTRLSNADLAALTA